MALDYDQLIHRVDFERYLGEADDAASYAAPVLLACYLETRTVQLEPEVADELGTQTGLEGTLWANATDLTPGSRFTIRGQAGYLGAATRYDDGNGLDHVEVEVTPRPPMAAQRTAVVSLIDPADSTTAWDDEDEVTRTTPATPYADSVTATIAEAAKSSRVEVAEEIVRIAPYLVTVHRDIEARAGHLVKVITAPGDSLLQGRQLRVEHVVLGSQRLQRQLYCSIDD